MKKKSLKNSLINIVGILLIVGGLSIIGFEYWQDYSERAALERDRQAMLDNIFDVDEEVVGDIEVQNPTDNNVWALLSIKDINLDLPVMLGDDFSLMRRYLMAYSASSLPPNPGNVSIAGHRGRCTLCGFTKLVDLSKGAEIKLVAREATYVYKLTDSFIVDKSETWVLDDIEDKTTLTLITCVTSSKNPKRQIVQAELIEKIPNN
jgi:sortase A